MSIHYSNICIYMFCLPGWPRRCLNGECLNKSHAGYPHRGCSSISQPRNGLVGEPRPINRWLLALLGLSVPIWAPSIRIHVVSMVDMVGVLYAPPPLLLLSLVENRVKIWTVRSMTLGNPRRSGPSARWVGHVRPLHHRGIRLGNIWCLACLIQHTSMATCSYVDMSSSTGGSSHHPCWWVSPAVWTATTLTQGL